MADGRPTYARKPLNFTSPFHPYITTVIGRLWLGFRDMQMDNKEADFATTYPRMYASNAITNFGYS